MELLFSDIIIAGYCLCKWNDIVWLYAAFVTTKVQCTQCTSIRPMMHFVGVLHSNNYKHVLNRLFALTSYTQHFILASFEHIRISKTLRLSFRLSLSLSLRSKIKILWPEKVHTLTASLATTSILQHKIYLSLVWWRLVHFSAMPGFCVCVLFYYLVNVIILQHLFIVIITIFRHDNVFIVRWHHGRASVATLLIISFHLIRWLTISFSRSQLKTDKCEIWHALHWHSMWCDAPENSDAIRNHCMFSW